MRIDPDKFRALLIHIGDRPAGLRGPASALDPGGLTPNEVFECVENMLDAGLIEAKLLRRSTGEGGGEAMIQRLTHQGQEFLTNIENQAIWNQVKEKAAETGGKVSTGILVQLAAAALKHLVGL